MRRDWEIDATGIDGNAKPANGEVVPDTSAVAMHVDLNDFKLPSIQPYRRVHADDAVERVERRPRRQAREAERRRSGSVDVAKLHTIDNALRQEFISWDRWVSGIEYTSQTESCALRPSRPTRRTRA
jgi:hypothetical protein